MKIKDSLIELGLTANEADVYLVLLELESSKAGEIVKKTGLHRNIVYEALERLIIKGLAFRLDNKKIATFRANSPDRIITLTKNRVELAEELLPLLKKRKGSQQELIFYEGREGFQRFNIEMIKLVPDRTEILVLGSLGSQWYDLMEGQINRYQKIWRKKRLKLRVIEYQPEEKDKEVFGTGPQFKVRTIPRGGEPPADTVIWLDRIALQTAVEPCSVIEIKNAALAAAYRNYFEEMWKQAKIYK